MSGHRGAGLATDHPEPPAVVSSLTAPEAIASTPDQGVNAIVVPPHEVQDEANGKLHPSWTVASPVRILRRMCQLLGRGHHRAPPREKEHAPNPSPAPSTPGSAITGQSIQVLEVSLRQPSLLCTATNEILHRAHDGQSARSDATSEKQKGRAATSERGK